MKKITIITLTFLMVISCKSDDDDQTTEPTFGSVKIDFNNVIDNKTIALNNLSYTNDSNETYTIAELKYIVSNIVLIKANGEEFKYPTEQSYFLINEEVETSKSVSLSEIASGEYSKIKFGVGVDQSKYPFESGMANFIPTAEENAMVWNWSAGYIFFKFEGGYTTNAGPSTDFLIHVGSHGTALDNYKEITLDLPSTLTIAEGAEPILLINADITKVFDSTNTHSLAVKNSIQVDPEFAPKIAENVMTMFNAISITK
ncbi:MbnP family protein [Aquimarina sediminis]|uniref:MbnP family protein n=1 Tax=Aquimarina sediminis TaxID=2070536 RepID=UPI000CA03943|nr:MbnP family protein [Aquimarina sediminis]